MPPLPLTKPRYDLAKAQKTEPKIYQTCVRDACALMGIEDEKIARKHIRKLFRSLKSADFAHVELMPQRSGSPMYGDVYGKTDQYGVWFMKIDCSDGVTTLIMSCHEPRDGVIELADGRTLRKKR